MRAAIAGWGTAAPRAPADQRRPRTARRHHRRSGSSSAPASASAASPHRRRDDRSARDRRRRRRDQARRASPPTTSTSSSSPPPRPSSSIPHTGAFVSDGLGLALRLVRPQRRRARASSTSSSSARRCSTAGNLDHVLVVGAETLSPHHRSRTTAAPASSSATARPRSCSSATPDDGPGSLVVGPRLRRLGRRRSSRSRRAGAACRPRAETVAERRALHQDGGPGGVPAGGAHRRRLGDERAATAPASTVDDVAWFVPHQANVRIIEAAAQPARHPAGAHAREHRPLRQHLRGLDPARARRGRRRRPPPATATSCCSPASAPGSPGAARSLRWGQRVSDARRRPDRVAFVTGASRGIGRAIAVALGARRPPGRVLLLVRRRGRQGDRSRDRGGRRRGARGAGRRRRRRLGRRRVRRDRGRVRARSRSS